MKDQVFSGVDVPAALAAASRALGIPAAQLRHIVLDQGRAGGLGARSSPAQVAVLLDAAAPARTTAAEPRIEARPAAVAPAERDLPAALRTVVREFGRAADIELEPEVVAEARGGLLVRIAGADAAKLGRDEIDALVHVLQKAGSRGTLRVPVAVECAGGRIGRDDELRATAVALGAEVRASQEPRETPALNGYERRVVHMTLGAEPDLETYSVGEGEGRRVRIVLRTAAGSSSELM